MKALMILVLVFLTTSCATYRYTMRKNQVSYIDCVLALTQEGLKADQVGQLCDKAMNY